MTSPTDMASPSQVDRLSDDFKLRSCLATVGVATVMLSTTNRANGRLVLLTVAFGALLLLLTEVRRSTSGSFVLPLSLSSLFAWALASLSWNYRLDAALQSTVLLACTVLVSLAICGLGGDALGYGLRYGSVVAVGINLLFQLASPDLATSRLEGSWQWRGLMGHKQQLGLIAGVATFAALHGAWCSRRHRSGWLFVTAVCALALVNAKSSLALSAFVVTALTVVALHFLDGSSTRTRALVCLACLGFAALLVGSWTTAMDLFTTSTGKDGTLTGRTDLWPQVLRVAADRPLIGYGINSLWRGNGAGYFNGPVDSITAAIREGAGWGANSAHNGYLETYLGLGLVGVLLLCATIIGSLRRYLRVPPPSMSYRTLTFFALMYITFLSFGESFIYVPQGILLLTVGVVGSAERPCV